MSGETLTNFMRHPNILWQLKC